jgi:hypothetical protein
MITKLLKIFIILIFFFSYIFAFDDIAVNAIEVQKHGSHIFLDMEIQNFNEDTIYLHEDLNPFNYTINTNHNTSFMGGGGGGSSSDIDLINIYRDTSDLNEGLVINYKDTLFLDEILSYFNDEDFKSENRGGWISYTSHNRELIPLEPGSSIILQKHFLLNDKVVKALKSMTFEGSYFIPISGGKLLGKKLKPLEIEVSL